MQMEGCEEFISIIGPYPLEAGSPHLSCDGPNYLQTPMPPRIQCAPAEVRCIRYSPPLSDLASVSLHI